MKSSYSIIYLLISLSLVSCTDNYMKSEPTKTPIDQVVATKVEIIEKNGITHSITPFIPEGWNIVSAYGGEIVEGDLNDDGISDIAFVVQGKETEIATPPRILMIVTGNKDGTYKLSVKAEYAIRRSDQGGIMGEPFMGLSVEEGTLLINHYGGSAWRWSDSYRFKYLDDGWFLIGSTEDWFNVTSSAGRRYEDINYLTGDYVLIETDDEGVEKQTKGYGEVKKLLNLEEFDVINN